VGSGISFSNATLNCAPGASARFTTISSNLGLDSGIILTSGKAKTNASQFISGADGPQNAYFAANSNNTPGDGELGQLGGIQTFDACILEFDFVPDGDSLAFEYVFGSEEYDSYSCSGFNDVFGFFLSGPFFPNANIALIPGTNIPVAINSTTNPAITMPFSTTACQQMGPGSPFGQYYNDNSQGQSITYYGLTTVLTARAPVVACTTYHIKLAIADGGDGTLDSGVFLAANSFRSTNVKLAIQSGLGDRYPFLVEGCTNGTIRVTRDRALPVKTKFIMTYTGTATRDVDYFNVPDSVIIQPNDTSAYFTISPIQDNILEPGGEIVTVNVINPCNNLVIESISFPVFDYLPFNMVDDTLVCEGTPVRLETDEPTFNWTWTSKPASTIDNANSYLATGYPDTTTVYTASGTYLGCITDTMSMTAFVEPTPRVNILSSDTVVCLSDSMVLRAVVGPSYFDQFTYLWSPTDYMGDPTVLQAKIFTQENLDLEYFLTATTPLGCTGSDSITVHTRPPLELTNVTADATIKYGDSIQLNADGARFYTWTPTSYLSNANVQSPYAFPIDPTLYTLYAINEFGCRDTAYVRIGIDYSMSEWLPSAFSPNGDGLNDVFRVKDLKFRTLQEFRIYNRWGQEVFSTTNPGRGWDGTFNGTPADPGVYHYIIRVGRPDGTMQRYKGDVTLLR
jgi:gliding motility-associated-like protein